MGTYTIHANTRRAEIEGISLASTIMELLLFVNLRLCKRSCSVSTCRLTLLLAGRVTNQAESATGCLGARNANRPETRSMCIK